MVVMVLADSTFGCEPERADSNSVNHPLDFFVLSVYLFIWEDKKQIYIIFTRQLVR
jgi:hypothetical protein